MMRKLFKRSANLLLSGFSFLRSSFDPHFTEAYGMPVAVNMELSSYCNLKCPECATGSDLIKRPAGFMDIDLFRRIAEELGPYLYNMNLYYQGESMMHPRFFIFPEIINGIPATLSTNGHFLAADPERLVKSGLRKLIVSVDGADQETYSAYRKGGNLNLVLKGLELVREARAMTGSKMKVEIQTLLNSKNEKQIIELNKLAVRMKARLVLKSMQILHNERISTWQPVSKSFRRYKEINGEYTLKSSLPNSCARLWFNPVITWDGRVLPCCFDKNAEHVMGDLKTDSFRDIWNGPRYRIFRRELAMDRKGIEICRNCTSGLRGVKH